MADLKRQEDELKHFRIANELAATDADIEAVAKVESNYSIALNLKNISKLPDDDNSGERQTLATGINSKDQVTPGNDLNPLSPPIPTTHPSFILPTPPLAVSQGEMSKESLPVSTITRDTSPHVSAGYNANANGDSLTRLADPLAQRQDYDSLPRPQPDVFSGDILQYPIWIKAFETLIERKTNQPSERLYYLGKYTSGEAKEAVSGLLPLDTETAYAKAKKILVNRFGNSFLASNVYQKKLENWPKIALNDGPGLRRYSDFLQHCCTAMDKINCLNVLDDPEENRKMLSKLPNYLVNRWGRIVDDRIGEDVNERSDDEDEVGMPQKTEGRNYPSFKEFSRFLKKEAWIACNPVISQCFLKGESKKKEVKESNHKQSRYRNVGVNSFVSQTEDFSPTLEESLMKPRNDVKKLICIFCKEMHK
ncbi:Hypothetical predicted protein [Paramuricea clavata]|uniref:Uncharacterized protein n=1 Tax=Paramuricea clavata TaxID=317549 RepID=A0A6S7IMQ7_PARCT|nr:Hypothetical predicted protein [Paramuricea clavata]